jgi:SLT domain-containing protein
MQLPTIPKIGRLSKKRKITAAGAAAAAGVVLTVTGLQATSGTAVAASDPTGHTVSTASTASQQAPAAAPKADANKQAEAASATSVPQSALVAQPAAAKTYTNNLDGWIKQSLDILHAHHIPASYNGIYRNIIRESSGNPQAINLWDINAKNGVPSKGLLQVIDPTFRAYHVAGTSWNIYDPVANITAACNYAAAKYGSMDNVHSAY